MQVTVQAPAKINLTLDVVGTRPDGYHLLESVMQTVDRCDTLFVRPAPAGCIALEVQGADVGAVEKNTVYRAAKRFFEYTGVAGGADIRLEKRIPQQAGMGGGSADAAAALRALDALYDTRLSLPALQQVGLQVGADVPFCVTGGTAFVTGVGEGVRALPALPDCYVVVAQPPEGVSTVAAYQALDGAPIQRRPNHSLALQAIQRGDLTTLCQQVENVFEPALAVPGVAAVRRCMDGFAPLCSQMTGSGSAVFAVFSDRAAAQTCLAALQETWPGSFICHPCGLPPLAVSKDSV